MVPSSAPPVPATMRAAVITRHGGLDAIELREVPVRRPGPRVNDALARTFDELTAVARRGSMRPVLAATFGLEGLAAAQSRLARRRHVGKLVVVPPRLPTAP